MVARLVAMLTAFTLAVAGLVVAQEDPGLPAVSFTPDDSATVSTGDEFSKRLVGLLKKARDLEKALRESDAETINAALQPLIRESSGHAFLRDINFKIKAFDAKDDQTGLGFSYDYEKAIAPRYTKSATRTRGVQADLALNGNVAFDDNINPEDFLDSRFSFRIFQSTGGVDKGSLDAREEGANLDRQRLNEIDDVLAAIEDPNELASHPLNKELFRLQRALRDQVYVDFHLHGGLESNQAFTRKHFTYGGQVGFVYRAYDPDSWGSLANVFDYPFALIRAATGYDEGFTPLGATWPSLLLGVEQVEPDDDDPRSVLEGTEEYTRFRGELAFRTPIARLGDDRVYFDANWRYYRELNASQIVKDADLDEFEYLVLTINSTGGPFVSYTKGRLPFDLTDTESFQVGFRFYLEP